MAHASIFTVELSTEWCKWGVCAQATDPDVFYSNGSTGQETAKGLCASCPVRSECLEFALMAFVPTDDHGIWGGTTRDERKRLRAQRGISSVDRRFLQEEPSD